MLHSHVHDTYIYSVFHISPCPMRWFGTVSFGDMFDVRNNYLWIQKQSRSVMGMIKVTFCVYQIHDILKHQTKMHCPAFQLPWLWWQIRWNKGSECFLWGSQFRLWIENTFNVYIINTLRPRQIGRHFANKHFEMHFLECKCLNSDWYFIEVCS